VNGHSVNKDLPNLDRVGNDNWQISTFQLFYKMAGRQTGVAYPPPSTTPFAAGARATLANFSPTPPMFPAGPVRATFPTPEPSFHIPAQKVSAFANLYGLLTAMDLLENEFCSGHLANDDYQKWNQEFKSQLSKVRTAHNLSTADICTFCVVSGLDVTYLSTLIDEPVVTTPAAGNRQAMQVAMSLGSDFTTLADLCEMNREGRRECKEFMQYIVEIKSKLTILGTYPVNADVKEMTDRWISEFGTMKPNDYVPAELSGRLAAEIPLWKSEAPIS
jgi:hypothetical protein